METSRTPVFHRYSVIEKIGSGGMGTVYKAHDLHLDRLVALKVLPPALQEDEAALERFNREARALAHLNHPRVASVFDAHCEGGFPHLVMELIDGENLERLLRKRRTLSTAEVVRIGIDVAEALAHIHTHRIVHRDVKTSNIIMEPEKGAVLADFGIAIEVSLPRLSGGALGTPEYMSPEQAEGRELDGRSDVYSLGVVLYECLAGHPPFRREDDSLASLMDLMHRVTNEPAASLERICPDVPQWLCASVMRCLEKDPNERLASAGELADALRRERAPARPANETNGAPSSGGRARGRSVSPDRTDAGAASAEPALESSSPQDVPTRQETTVLTHVEPVQAVACGPDGRVASGSNDGVARIWDGSEGRLLHTLRQHQSSVLAVAFSRDGRYVATGDRLGRLCLWDGGTGRLLHEIDALGSLVLALAFSPDGKTLVSGAGDRAVRMWHVRTGKLAGTLGWHQGYVLSAAFSADASQVVSSGSDGRILVWDVGRGVLKNSIQAHRGWAMAVDLSADGQTIVSGGADRHLRIWTTSSGALLHEIEGHSDAVMAAAFSPSGRYVVSAGRDGCVRMWDARSGDAAGRLGVQDGAVMSVAFSPDGRQVAAAGDDRTVRVWSLDRRRFGRRGPIKRAIAWATIVLLALASLGPVEVATIDFAAGWARAAQSAANVFAWMQSEVEPAEGDGTTGSIAHGPDAVDATGMKAENERTEEPAGSHPDAGRDSKADGNVGRRAAPIQGGETAGAGGESTASRDGNLDGAGGEPTASSTRENESRQAGMPAPRSQTAGPEGNANDASEPRPARFHPLYGGGSLVVGLAGWTIEVGRLRSIRGATWLVEQYRDMGFRASVIGLNKEDRFIVGVGHFEARSDAEHTLLQLRGRELPYRIFVTKLRWDRMVAQR